MLFFLSSDPNLNENISRGILKFKEMANSAKRLAFIILSLISLFSFWIFFIRLVMKSHITFGDKNTNYEYNVHLISESC